MSVQELASFKYFSIRERVVLNNVAFLIYFLLASSALKQFPKESHSNFVNLIPLALSKEPMHETRMKMGIHCSLVDISQHLKGKRLIPERR